MKRWQPRTLGPTGPAAVRVLAILGHLVFGLPAFLAFGAAYSTMTTFGAVGLAAAAPLAVGLSAPEVMWWRYQRTRESRGARMWLGLLALVSLLWLLTPVFFWAAFAAVVLLGESARRLCSHRQQIRSMTARRLAAREVAC